MVIQKLIKSLINYNDWRTKRKLIVIESDDWGSIRMPSAGTYKRLLNSGIRVDNCPYNRYDSLASEEDLSILFEVLKKYRDKNGNHPVITVNCVVANPDFGMIERSGFKHYHYELFTETLKKYPNHANSFVLWKMGINEKIFFPQFHGREHLNVRRWMKNLQAGSEETRLTFKEGLFGISTDITSEKRKSYMSALELDDISELSEKQEILKEGLVLFEKLFGYRSSTFIATNYTWPDDIELQLFKNGVKYLQGINLQYSVTNNQTIIKKHYLGATNKTGQVYLSRNCFFEPSLDRSKDWIKSCLDDITIAFIFNKPATITSHRLNFIGSIDPLNRERNLKSFSALLQSIIKRWPDVEFLTSEQLGDLILKDKLK